MNINSGIAYHKDPDTGEERWDFINTQDSSAELPFGQTLKVKVDMWNIQATKFFRRYVYDRLLQTGLGTFSCLLGVFFCNSIWHGVYPAYWTVTPLAGLMIGAARCLYRFWRNKIKGSQFINDQEVIYFSGIAQWWVGSPIFILLDMLTAEKCVKFLNSVYWYPFLVPLATILFFNITGWGQRPSSKAKKGTTPSPGGV